MAWFYTVVLQGGAAKDVSSLTFQLKDPADYAAAAAMANSIRGSLVDITDAFVKKESITSVIFEDNTRPADTVKVFEEAVAICHIGATGEAEKLHPLRVPGPISALFQADGQTLNTANLLLQQFVQQVSQGAYVSDGEVVNTALDAGGIKYGYKRSRPRKFKN